MLTQRYYDAFAKIFIDKLQYERVLYEKNIINSVNYDKRRELIADILLEFIAFMQEDNSQFDVKSFERACGL